MDAQDTNSIASFLEQNCPDPSGIMRALERTALHSLADFHPGAIICEQGDPAEACWLIVEGHVEVQRDGIYVATRQSGELIGEQAFLKTLRPGGRAARAASLIARTNVRLLCIDAAFHEQLTQVERANWFLTFAAVVNEKLDEATGRRANLQQMIEQRDSLLARFADNEPLGFAKATVSGTPSAAQRREAIVWFSDISGFSAWASKNDPTDVARVVKILLSAQADLIHANGGTIDKFIGDGLMAFWFVDTEARKESTPARAIRCAEEVTRETILTLEAEGLIGQLDIRIGMHCGPVAFGDFGARDRVAVTMVGETVNLAARFEQARSPDLRRIRISAKLAEAATAAGADLSAFRGPFAVEVKADKINILTL